MEKNKKWQFKLILRPLLKRLKAWPWDIQMEKWEYLYWKFYK